MQNLCVRPATSLDRNAIIDIHNANARGQSASNERGFLLAPVTKEELLEKIEKGTQYFVATGSSNVVLGFVAVSMPDVSDDLLNQIHWEDDGAKRKIANYQNIYIQTVATRLDMTGKGIARLMYQSLYDTFPDAVFTAFIASKPITNHRSIVFHTKQGFQHVGTVRYDQFLDLKDYEGMLMLKDSHLQI